jgi:hypothetical protein
MSLTFGRGSPGYKGLGSKYYIDSGGAWASRNRTQPAAPRPYPNRFLPHKMHDIPDFVQQKSHPALEPISSIDRHFRPKKGF